MISRADNTVEHLKLLCKFSVNIHTEATGAEYYEINKFNPLDYIKEWNRIIPIIRDILKHKHEGFTRLIDAILILKDKVYPKLTPLSKFYIQFGFMEPDGKIHDGYPVYYADDLYPAYERYLEGLWQLFELLITDPQVTAPIKSIEQNAVAKDVNSKGVIPEYQDKNGSLQSEAELNSIANSIIESLGYIKQKEDISYDDFANLVLKFEKSLTFFESLPLVKVDSIDRKKLIGVKMLEIIEKIHDKTAFEKEIIHLCDLFGKSRTYHKPGTFKIVHKGLRIKNEYIEHIQEIFNILYKEELVDCHPESFTRLLCGETSIEPITFQEVRSKKVILHLVLKEIYGHPQWKKICNFIKSSSTSNLLDPKQLAGAGPKTKKEDIKNNKVENQKVEPIESIKKLLQSKAEIPEQAGAVQAGKIKSTVKSGNKVLK